MSLEDQVKFHEQLLRSIESNLGKVTDDLAQLAELVRSMGVVMLRQAEHHDQLAEHHDRQSARIDRLEELFERWLRSQTNGQN